MHYLIPLLTSLLQRLPALIVLGVGIALAISRSRSHPRASMLAAIGFGSYLLVGLVSGIFFGVAPLVLRVAPSDRVAFHPDGLIVNQTSNCTAR